VILPPPHAVFDYQIGGAYPPAAEVRIVDRDRLDPPVPGRYNVCYVNAFQTQDNEVAWWKAHHRRLLLRRDGRFVHDPGWPGEILLNTSTPDRRRAIVRILGRWMDGCAQAGFAAVEPDNLDSWTRSHRLLTRRDNVALARRLAARAHTAGLAIAQKNTAGLHGKSIGFDFAIAEECQVYRECGTYTREFGRRVYEIEYPDNGGRANFRLACRRRGGRISVIYRDRDVVPKGHAGYVYRTC
jgi:hypothetical protein